MFAVKKRGEEEGPKVENWLTVSKVTRLQKKSSLVTVWTNRLALFEKTKHSRTRSCDATGKNLQSFYCVALWNVNSRFAHRLCTTTKTLVLLLSVDTYKIICSTIAKKISFLLFQCCPLYSLYSIFPILYIFVYFCTFFQFCTFFTIFPILYIFHNFSNFVHFL